MQVRLEYGKTGLYTEIPDKNLRAVLKLPDAPPIENPTAAIEAAIASPHGSRPLVELAQGRANACIVVCDITRPVPNKVILPVLLRALAQGGIARDDVTILVATGTHRPNDQAELIAMLGEEAATTCKVINHVCTNKASHRYLGGSPAGTPVYLDETYCKADLKITTGLIEPHFMAGYSGGRKLVMPGVAALETIQYWHSPRFLEHPNATNGIVQGNPVHEEALAIVKMCPPDLITDVTLDEAGAITGVFAGDLENAWYAGVDFAKRHVRVPISEPVDVVVTSCAGHPLDATFYQAIKGMVGALPIVKPGGSIVIAASCSEGIGSELFKETLRGISDMGAFLHDIQQPDWEFIPEQWQIEEFARVACRHDVYCVCDGIEADLLSELSVIPVASVEKAVEALSQRYGEDASIAVIPKGPYVIPYVENVSA